MLPLASPLYSQDFASARRRFLRAAEAASAKIEHYPHPLPGPQGEALATDTALLGAPDAGRVLVLLSATHGVEGFLGSAAQLDFLRRYRRRPLPPGVAVLLIHAINPHGFAWLRRVTEEGVDLNRNWVDFSSPLPMNPGYDQLAMVLVPERLDATTLVACDRILADYVARHGQSAYERAVSGGQFNHPNGLFGGGTAPTWSRRISETIIANHRLSERRLVTLIDFHSGLGPFGYGEPICDHLPGSFGLQRAKEWFGESVTEPLAGTSSSVAKAGLSDYGWQEAIGERLVYIALEFGTYSFAEMVRVLRADHWLHQHGLPDWNGETTRRIKAEIRRYFYPASEDWQQMVLFRCRQVIGQALRGIAQA